MNESVGYYRPSLNQDDKSEIASLALHHAQRHNPITPDDLNPGKTYISVWRDFNKPVEEEQVSEPLQDKLETMTPTARYAMGFSHGILDNQPMNGEDSGAGELEEAIRRRVRGTTGSPVVMPTGDTRETMTYHAKLHEKVNTSDRYASMYIASRAQVHWFQDYAIEQGPDGPEVFFDDDLSAPLHAFEVLYEPEDPDEITLESRTDGDVKDTTLEAAKKIEEMKRLSERLR